MIGRKERKRKKGDEKRRLDDVTMKQIRHTMSTCMMGDTVMIEGSETMCDETNNEQKEIMKKKSERKKTEMQRRVIDRDNQ